ncbi:MAG: hypothetical protein QOI47_1901 [Actinomycetota bacterium]|jgi:hypothetical protein|nr:hypothetical protein [Actinomycetota bacterium]
MRRIPPFLIALTTAALALIPVADAGAVSQLATSTPTANFSLGGVPCNLIAVPTAAPVGAAESCPGVRPGGIVTSSVGQCTLNFLFTDPSGNRYIGTAGHCVLAAPAVGGQAGEHTWAPGTGPVASDGNGAPIGHWVYAILQDPKDFSLIRLDAGVASSPQMCHFGGPTGINSDTPGLAQPTTLEIYGEGVGVATVLPARSMLALGMPDADHVYAQGVVVPGDSGSGVISADGRAIGVAVTTGVHSSSVGTSGIDAGEVGITRLAPQLARAGQVLGFTLSLVTAPTL